MHASRKPHLSPRSPVVITVASGVRRRHHPASEEVDARENVSLLESQGRYKLLRRKWRIVQIPSDPCKTGDIAAVQNLTFFRRS